MAASWNMTMTPTGGEFALLGGESNEAHLDCLIGKEKAYANTIIEGRDDAAKAPTKRTAGGVGNHDLIQGALFFRQLVTIDDS